MEVSSIFSIDFYPNLSSNTLRVRVFTRGDVSVHSVYAEAMDGTTVVGTATGGFADFNVPVPNARRWSPDDPFLYNLRISLRKAADVTVDQTMHYFGMREVGTAVVNGRRVPTLNGQFVLQNGVLDQGFWPDGLYLRSLNRCMDVTGNGTANGTLVQLWDCHGGGNQQWVPQANGALLNPQSGRCLDSPGGSTANGARLQLWDCNGTAAQMFWKQ